MIQSIFKIFLILIGIVSVYQGYKTKKTGVVKISKYALSSVKKSKDDKEFIKRNYRINIYFGLLLICEGIYYTLKSYYKMPDFLLISLVIAVIIGGTAVVWTSLSNLPSYKNKNL